jgi:hypothetical protein
MSSQSANPQIFTFAEGVRKFADFLFEKFICEPHTFGLDITFFFFRAFKSSKYCNLNFPVIFPGAFYFGISETVQ